MIICKNTLNEAPEWFTKNITNRPNEHSVLVNGTEIKYFVWGDKSKTSFIVHGYNAPVLVGPYRSFIYRNSLHSWVRFLAWV